MTDLSSRHWSLQRSLMALVISTIFAAWVGASIVMWRAADQHASALNDEVLRHLGAALMRLTGPELQELGPDSTLQVRIDHLKMDSAENLGEEYRYQVWSKDGLLMLSNFGLPSASPMARLGQGGYSWLDMDGSRWRVYSLIESGTGHELHLAQQADARGWLLETVTWRSLALFPLSLLVVIAPAMLILRRLLSPMRQLRHQLVGQRPGELTPVIVSQAPDELLPVIDATNDLMTRMSMALKRESQFTSMAAHELRTPLATVRMQAELALTSRHPGQRDEALSVLMAGIDRCAHLQDQLLALARLEASETGARWEERALTDLVMEAVEDLVRPAKARGIRMAIHCEPAVLLCHPFGVRTMLHNLIGNAVKYTPDGGQVRVTARSVDGHCAEFEIDDSGPGIPEADRQRVFERFARLHRVESSGSGLGLSIVKQVVAAHRAHIHLDDSPMGGLRAVVRFEGGCESVGRGGEPTDSQPASTF